MTRGALWPLAIAGVLGVTVLANGFIYYEANRTPVPIEADYYRKAVDWDSTLAQGSRNSALGWHLDASLGRDGALAARVVDRSGLLVEGATVAVSGFALAYAGDFDTSLSPAPGAEYVGQVALAHPGLHELRFTVTRGTDRFTAVLRGEPGARFVLRP